MAMDILLSPTQPLCNFTTLCHNTSCIDCHSTPPFIPILIGKIMFDASNCANLDRYFMIFSYFPNRWSGVLSIIPYPPLRTNENNTICQVSPSIGPEQQPEDAAASRQLLMPAGIQDVSTQMPRDPREFSPRTAKKHGEHFEADHLHALTPEPIET